MCLIKLVAPLSHPTSTSCRHRERKREMPSSPRASSNLPLLASFPRLSHFLSLQYENQLKSVNDSGLRFQVRLEFLSIDALPFKGPVLVFVFFLFFFFLDHIEEIKETIIINLGEILGRYRATKLEIKNSSPYLDLN